MEDIMGKYVATLTIVCKSLSSVNPIPHSSVSLNVYVKGR